MDELALVEKIAGGTLGGMVVLTVVAFKFWKRLGERDTQLLEQTERFISATTKFETTVADNTRVMKELCEAIERGEHRAPRRIAG